MTAVGILHPGAMGIFVAASAQNSGNVVCWVSDGRSPATRARADKYKLREVAALRELIATCSTIVSVCPPDSAKAVAEQVMGQSFRGLYVDANAIAPQRATHVGELVTRGGARFVDGGIIGGPSWETRDTILYLSGTDAEQAAALFAAGPIQPRVIGNAIGQASALKMCYAAYTKGTTALLSAILGTAQALGVRAELEAQWSSESENFVKETHSRVCGSTAKAWRFVGEMEEIANTFREAGLPGEFHAAAREIYQRMAKFKDAEKSPELEQVLDALSMNHE